MFTNDTEGYCAISKVKGSDKMVGGCGVVELDSPIEPDAMNYRCPECGHRTLMGMEQALLMGLLADDDLDGYEDW